MLVLAAVTDLLAARLRRATGGRFAFTQARSWASALRSVRRQPIEMAVVDPGLEGEPRAQEIERLRVLFPSLPLILYTRLTPHIVPVLLRVGEVGVRRVLLEGYDDHPERVTETLVEEATFGVSRQLLHDIADVLNDCPGELRWALESVVRNPAAFQSVQDLAARARMDRRTCARWFAKAALPPPSTILTVLRVVYGHRLLQDPGYTVEDVAAKLGYSKTRSFVTHVKEIFGMTPGELRLSLSPEEGMRQVRERYFRREPTVAMHAS